MSGPDKGVVTAAAYRTADESGSPEAAGTVAWNWISEIAQAQRKADAAMLEIVSEPVKGGGRVTRLYRGSTLLAVATTFRDVMNYTVFVPWVAPELYRQSAQTETLAVLEQAREALDGMLKAYDGIEVRIGCARDARQALTTLTAKIEEIRNGQG